MLCAGVITVTVLCVGVSMLCAGVITVTVLCVGVIGITLQCAPGLDALHTLTSTQTHELRVDLEDWDGNKFFATYSNFSVSDSSDNYRLHFDSFTGGNAGKGLV